MDPDQNNGGQTPGQPVGDDANQAGGDDQGMVAKCEVCGRGLQDTNCVGCAKPNAECDCQPIQEEPPAGGAPAGGEMGGGTPPPAV